MAESFTPNRSGKAHSFDEPAPTVQRFGIADERPTSMTFADDGRPPAPADPSKPPYRIPLLDEIRAVPPNGLTVMSTFSGCGGSCLGFEWAGWNPLLAVEFVPAAADSYRANHPGVPVWTDDIRDLTAEKALDLMGLAEGELVCLEGSPPCESFSTSGKRSSGWGQVRAYSDGKRQVMDDLFYEFSRLLGGIRPRSFVAENVSGLVKGVSKGYFLRIHAHLEEQGYKVRARMLDAQWLGVPQRRQRVIFVGIRDDLDVDPDDCFPSPLPYRYSIRDALADLGASARIVFENGGEGGAARGGRPEEDLDAPARTITNAHAAATHFKITEEQKVEGGAPLTGTVRAAWETLEQGQSHERYFDLTRADAEKPSPTVSRIGGSGGLASVAHPSEPRKFSIAELRRLCGFPDSFDLKGTYAQQWERLGNSVPPPMAYAVARKLAERLGVDYGDAPRWPEGRV